MLGKDGDVEGVLDLHFSAFVDIVDVLVLRGFLDGE